MAKIYKGLLRKIKAYTQTKLYALKLWFISLISVCRFGKAYESCTELPLYNFIKIIVTGDLHWLVRRGWVPNKQPIWDKIFDEYTELNPDKKQLRVHLLVKEINYLQNKLYIIQNCVKLLETRDTAEIKDILRKYGYRDLSDLRGIITQSKVLTLQIKDKKAELETLQVKGKQEKTLTESDFDETLVTLGKHFGYRIDSRKETVSSYCALIKSLNEDLRNGATRTDKRTYK